jgi:hypothetical protein
MAEAYERRAAAGRKMSHGAGSMEDMRLRYKADYTIETLTRVRNELGGSDPERIARIPGRQLTVEVFLDGAWHVRRPVNDDEIVERGQAVGEITGREVALATGDYKMLYRASAASLKAVLVRRPGDNGVDSV